MPFLEHLEELRWRILWSLAALLVGTAVGFWAVQHFDIVGLLKRPIAGYLPASGKLFFTHPTDAFFVIFKLSLIVGAVLASPVIVWQAWAFFSPALYAREKRYIVPTLFGGLLLFVLGVLLSYSWVLPAAFRILLGFQTADFEPIITADNYFGFAMQLILAFGLAFELPLVIMVLSLFGVVTPRFLSTNRRYWVVIAAVAAAVITPTPDALTMLVMMVPLILLYELGIVLARIVTRAKKESPTAAGPAAGTTVALAVLLLGSLAVPAQSQVVRPPAQQPAVPVQDTTRAPGAPVPGQAIDTASARRLGLPTAPSRALPAPDSVMDALLKRTGFQTTRFGADSLTFHADTRRIDLTGSAVVERDGSTLEADSVRFAQIECRIDAEGEPKLFDQGTVLVGEGMQYDTCQRRGTVSNALTKFNQSGVAWFLRGRLSIDSASTRIYAGGSTMTSSDLPLPDYHFAAGRVKWVSNTIMVARPAVLYVRDVPILWLPFIFQDMRRGRRSGILVPRFGINDLVRTNPGYKRHISNVGYYWAISDYLDTQASLDWYAGTSVALNGQIQYRWLNRFINGSGSLTRLWESGSETGPGSRALRLAWNHQQQFNLRTRLSANIDYATSSRIIQRNSTDPYLTTATLRSAGSFSKQFSWGTFNTGGSRSQDLSTGVVTLQLPSVAISPAPINLSPSVTWNPGFSFTNDRTMHERAGTLVGPPVGGVPTEDSLFADTQNMRMHIGSSFRLGRWSLPLEVDANHNSNTRRSAVALRDPADSTRTFTRYYNEDFTTTLDWNPSLSLPTVFPSTWKIQPRVGVQNSTSGSFVLRNRYTNGKFVTQGKRASFGASLTPSLFGFFPGVGPLARIRHSISPSISWSYAPPGTVPEAYARAIDPTGQQPDRRSPRQHTVSLGFSQIFEGKFRPAPGDTGQNVQARKIKLLSVQTSALSYDFEQAKMPGRNGWTTGTMNNQFTSDLLPGFSFSMTHDLWRGTVGYDTAAFDPFLSNVSARFSITGATIRGLTGLITGKREVPAATGQPRDTTQLGIPSRITTPMNPGFSGFGRSSPIGTPGARRPFAVAVTYDDSRVRPTANVLQTTPTTNRTLGLGIGFSPTPGWSVSWDTQYNLTTKEFGQHVLRLERDLRRWQATFGFQKAPNGNFQFDFFITLLDQRDIKFQYDQRTVR